MTLLPFYRAKGQLLLLAGLLLTMTTSPGGARAQTAPARPSQRGAAVRLPVPAAEEPLVIGHAGSGFLTLLRPFNPLPPSSRGGIRRALRRGADGVEVDVRLSQDSIPVLYHDATLESMTTGTGCVSQTPARELVRLHYRVRWPFSWFQNERLHTVESLLAYWRNKPSFPYLHLDLHEDDPCAPHQPARSQALARQLRTLLTRHQAPPARVTIITTRPATLRYLHQLLPTVGLGLEVDDNYAAALAELPALPGVGSVVLHKDDITPERTAQLHALGREVIVFGGRSARAVGRVVAARPDAYEVDNLRQLRSTLRRQRKKGRE